MKVSAKVLNFTRFIFYLCFVCLVLVSFTQKASAQIFNDVPYEHEYGNAISYLKSFNIIQGYDDNTFRPDQKINRVEFLKIVLASVNVPLNVTESTGFPDINESEWYGSYVKKAKREGWIQGYTDNTFRPLNPVNKVEALKILGEVQKWDRLEIAEVPKAPFEDTYRFVWYSPYAHFAKENNLLFKETQFLNPGEEITRGYMAELVYRSLTSDVVNYDPSAEGVAVFDDNPVPTPETYTTLSEDYFDGVLLSESMPNTFYKNEIYLLEGEITSGLNFSTIFAFLAKETANGNEYTHLKGISDGTHFKIPMIFKEPGNYTLGMLPGNTGSSRIANIHVLDGIPLEGGEQNASTPFNLLANFQNDTTTFSWDDESNNVFRIHYIQNDQTHSYFVRNQKSFDAFYKDFKRFNEGTINWQVIGARASGLKPLTLSTKWNSSTEQAINAVTHHFQLSVENAITYSALPEKLDSPQSVNVSGTTFQNIFEEGAVIRPDGTTELFTVNTNAETVEYFGNELIPAGSQYSFQYTPASFGTYIIEINNQGGLALINTPIYIGNIIPLIPDFFDLQDPDELTDSINLGEFQNELLTYINNARLEQGLGTVKLENSLNTLSQLHTDDMKENNYFAHINLAGETPDDRRRKLNIPTPIGENLAHGPTLHFIHNAFMRSAIHRDNILSPTWTLVGLGFSLDATGNIFLAEEFSHDPWTNIDLENFENEVIDFINTKRISNLTVNSTLRDITRNWSQELVDQNFFSFVAPSGINLIEIVQNSGISSEGRVYILKEGSLDTLIEKLLNDSDVEDNRWGEIGIGIKQDQWSGLYLTVIYIE